MASSVTSEKQCVKCDKGGGIAICPGCQKIFCVKHLIEHRQELEMQMDILGQKHDVLRRDLLQEVPEHPLFARIDTWEKESITKIQVTAEVARADLRELLNDIQNQLKTAMDKFTNEIQTTQKDNDYTEVELDKLTKKLNELRAILEMPETKINLSENYSPSSINLIKVDSQIRSPTRINSLTSFQERFDRFYGPAIVLEQGLLIMNTDDEYSRICGTKQYTTGQFRIKFQIVERKSICPFLGIISLLESLNLKKITLPSANGWSDLDYVITSGKRQSTGFSNSTIQSGDELTLVLNCENREIQLEHHRTNRIVRQFIDLQECPFPWKLLVALSSQNDSIRLVEQ